MRVLLWHVHGSWTNAFVRGGHTYLLPVTHDRGPDGLGRAQTWTWPENVLELTPDELRDTDVDVVVLQRPHEPELVEKWAGRRVGTDLPAVYVEHNTPAGDVPWTRHPLAERDDVPVAHVTHFNRLMWDCGRAPTEVVEHGVVDHGDLWSGDLERAGVVVNDPVRRGRAVGTDLLAPLSRVAPVDVFGMRTDRLQELLPEVAVHDLPQDRLHRALALRRVYVHLPRWTSLGLSLLEAMSLGMPVVALGTTEVPRAIPPGTGVVSTRPDELLAAVRELLEDRARAAELGAAGRRHVLAAYGLERFLADWDDLLARVVAR